MHVLLPGEQPRSPDEGGWPESRSFHVPITPLAPMDTAIAVRGLHVTLCVSFTAMADASFKDVPEIFEVCLLAVPNDERDAHRRLGRLGRVAHCAYRMPLYVPQFRDVLCNPHSYAFRFAQQPSGSLGPQTSAMLLRAQDEREIVTCVGMYDDLRVVLTSCTVRLLPLRLWCRRVFVGLPGGLHQLAHVCD